MKKIITLLTLLLAIFLTASVASAEEATVPVQKDMSDIGYSDTWDKDGAYQEGVYSPGCEKECQPHQTMKNMIEGRVANIGCLQTCEQRKVWEKLSTSISEVADSLKKNSYKEVLVPIEMKMDELKTKVDAIEQKLENLKI